jgi:putative Holliday junction resolvase
MKKLGIDYGSKKIGLALTDDAGMMAFPLAVVPNDSELMNYLKDLISNKNISEIVIGHSLNNQGQDNPIHSMVNDFVLNLTLEFGLPVHLEPEQYTSQQAKHIQGDSKLIDASAAAIILNSYLNKQT